MGVTLAVIATLAIAVPTAIISSITPAKLARVSVPASLPVIPKAIMPSVEPVSLAAITPDDARAINATVPFTLAPVPAAKPFLLNDAPVASLRAIDCLASAVLYEAGDDTIGQRAVAQVVLNRVRHPAFPKTICGVVFQGSERRTGCQFTFACDGALIQHSWNDIAWDRARTVAREALSGRVFAKVGYATHYHTDWVVPYWSASLDKVSAVGTHLFFRWTGWWGTPPAFNRQIASEEPVIGQLARFSPVHSTGLYPFAGQLAGTRAERLAALLAASYSGPGPIAGDDNAFLVTIDRDADPEALRRLAEAGCGDRPYCKYMVWAERYAVPTALPLEPSQIATMAFSYLRDRSRGFEKALWNCDQFPRTDRKQCMKVQTFVPGAQLADRQSKAPVTLVPAGERLTRASAADPVPGASALLPQKPAPTPPTP